MHVMENYLAIKKTNHLCNKMDESQKHFGEWKKPASKNHIQDDSIYKIFKKENSKNDDKEKIRGCQGLKLTIDIA